MKADIAGKTEYGTLLEYILAADHKHHSKEFWGVDHAARAIDYMKTSNLLAITLTHKFSPLERAVA